MTIKIIVKRVQCIHLLETEQCNPIRQWQRDRKTYYIIYCIYRIYGKNNQYHCLNWYSLYHINARSLPTRKCINPFSINGFHWLRPIFHVSGKLWFFGKILVGKLQNPLKSMVCIYTRYFWTFKLRAFGACYIQSFSNCNLCYIPIFYFCNHNLIATQCVV